MSMHAITAEGGTDAPPSIRIRSGRANNRVRLAEMWAYREVLSFLAWRDIKLRYKQTLLGAAWAVLQPLLAMLVFALFFGKFVRVPSDGLPYALFAYAGLVPWSFLSNAISNSGTSLLADSQLVTKIYFPRLLIPCASVVAALVDFAISGVLLAVLLVYYRVMPGLSVLLLPILALMTALLAFGVGTWMAALSVKFRDVKYTFPLAIQLWMFASPIVYPASIVPGRWRTWMLLNPLTGLIEGYRACLTGRAADWPALAVSALITAALVVSATAFFRRVETEFADII